MNTRLKVPEDAIQIIRGEGDIGEVKKSKDSYTRLRASLSYPEGVAKNRKGVGASEVTRGAWRLIQDTGVSKWARGKARS